MPTPDDMVSLPRLWIAGLLSDGLTRDLIAGLLGADCLDVSCGSNVGI